MQHKSPEGKQVKATLKSSSSAPKSDIKDAKASAGKSSVEKGSGSVSSVELCVRAFLAKAKDNKQQLNLHQLHAATRAVLMALDQVCVMPLPGCPQF